MEDLKGIFFKDFANSYIPHIFKELYLDRVYDSYFTGKSDLTVLDVGANIGLFSHYAYPFAQRIFAVEPASEHFDVMNHMFNHNKMDKVVPIKQAVSNENGKAVFHHSQNVTMYSLSEFVQDPNLEAEEVDTITMDRLFEEYNIDHVDFMKLDTEGAEGLIFNSEGFEKVAHKIDTIFYEWHTWGGYNANQINNVLRDYGFVVKQIPTEATVFSATRS